MMEVSLERAVTLNVSASLAAPEPMPFRATDCWGASSLIVTGPGVFNVGGSLTGFTVTENVRLLMLLTPVLSFTVTVIVTVPKALAAGVRVSVPVVLGL